MGLHFSETDGTAFVRKLRTLDSVPILILSSRAAEIAAKERWINNYPRKILGHMSSEVMFRACLLEIGLTA